MSKLSVSRTVLAGLLLLAAPLFAVASPANDRNWVAVHIYDSIYPMSEEQSFPELLNSLEIINQLYTSRNVDRSIRKAVHLNRGDFGDRSSEGHYMLWMHFSDRFLTAHPIDRKVVGEEKFIFPNRQTDIFTAWSGDTNVIALLRDGIRGLGLPVQLPSGRLSGNFQGFADAVRQGEADGAAGWYMNDEQAERILTTLDTYPGKTRGYSFLRSIDEKPNAPFEAPGTRLVNGYNCGDYAYYALTTAGVISRGDAESIKMHFWYPEKYFDNQPPLKGVGSRGVSWLRRHPWATTIPSKAMLGLAWFDLLFSPSGVEFFDKAFLVDEIERDQPRFASARIWEHTHAIEWIRTHADFISKGIRSELLRARLRGLEITSPERTVPFSSANTWRLSRDFQHYRLKGRRFESHKLARAGIGGDANRALRNLQVRLEHP